ncbi:MAG: winged helix-turn-helix domain-containing protein [Pseudomonadota bacterium]
MSREVLLDEVWSSVIVTDESLTQAISELRRAVEVAGGDRDLVVTVPKSGYRLRTCAIEEIEGAQVYLDQEEVLPIDAYCALLDAQNALIHGGPQAAKIAFELASEAIGRAPDSGVANACCAIMLAHAVLYSAAGTFRLRTAIHLAQRAVCLSPQSSIAHAALGFSLGAQDGGVAAMQALARSMALGDETGEGHYLASRVAFVSGDHRNAATLALRCAELVPDPSRPLFLAARATRFFDTAKSCAIAARCVRTLNERFADHPDEPRSQYTLGPALALAGDFEAAWRHLSKPRSDQSICLIHDFFGFALLNENARALDALESALDDGYRHGQWLLSEPSVTELRANQRFQNLTAAIAA